MASVSDVVRVVREVRATWWVEYAVLPGDRLMLYGDVVNVMVVLEKLGEQVWFSVKRVAPFPHGDSRDSLLKDSVLVEIELDLN